MKACLTVCSADHGSWRVPGVALKMTLMRSRGRKVLVLVRSMARKME